MQPCPSARTEMGGEKDNQCRVVRAQRSEPRSVIIVLLGREEAAPLGFPIIKRLAVAIQVCLKNHTFRAVN
jgi:hypothetical protein